jgi:hypothetical protein
MDRQKGAFSAIEGKRPRYLYAAKRFRVKISFYNLICRETEPFRVALKTKVQ